MDHADLLAWGSVSKHDRSRVEKRLANETASKVAEAIASMGGNGPLYDSFFSSVAKDIAALDERVAAPLWQRLEHRLICMAENDIDVCSEAEKSELLEKLINLSKHNLPSASHARVLAELTSAVNRSFTDIYATGVALCSMFEHCRDLPPSHRAAPLRSLLLSLPFGSSDAFQPRIRQLIDAMRREIPLLPAMQQSVIESDMLQANATMEKLFVLFSQTSELPLHERETGMADLVGKMLTLEHNYADSIITTTMRFFSSSPRLISAEMLASLVPMVGQISNRHNRAARLRMLVQLSDAFAAETRAPLIKNIAVEAGSLSESDRKRILCGMYRCVIGMNVREKRDVIQHINALGATLSVGQFAQVLVTLPTELQRVIREVMTAS